MLGPRLFTFKDTEPSWLASGVVPQMNKTVIAYSIFLTIPLNTLYKKICVKQKTSKMIMLALGNYIFWTENWKI